MYRSIRLLATVSGLISAFLILFLYLMMNPTHAQEAKGFPPGTKSFSNPFANPQGNTFVPNNDAFFDDEDEDEDFFNDFPPGQNLGGNNPRTNSRGVSLGGTSPGGVVSKTNIPSLQIDSESGVGSKEIVTDFNFPDADIMDIAKALGKLTGKNFILDKDVKGRITIISNSPITVGDAWKAFLTALDINGFATIPSGKYIRVARQRDARDKQLKTYSGEFSPDSDALITRIFPLKYINAEEVARTFRSFMPANSRIIPYNQTNTVIVTDTGSNISKLSKMLEILDVEGYDAGIEVIPVKYASAVELAKLIDTLIPGTGSAPRVVGGGAPNVPRFGGSRFSARKTKEGGVINTVIADERTNNLIVHANTRGADEVRELVAKLDQKVPNQAGGGRVHVIYLQFADAEQIANTLNNITSGAGSKNVGGGAGGATGTGTNPVGQTLFEGNIKVSADKSTNSLVVTGSAADFTTVQRVVNRLDIPRDEVYVETIIMEVSTGKRFEFTANVAQPTSGVFSLPNTEVADFLTNPISRRGAILSFATKETTNYKIGGVDVAVPNLIGLIRALQTHANANVLATPQIIALDNNEATFESGESLPVPQTNLSTSAATPSQVSFVKEKVALTMKIKPQINKLSNFVKLDIETKLQDVSNQNVPAQLQGQAFGTTERSAKTSAVVADGDTIVIGGLTRNKVQDEVSKVPILGDIPLLGWLFRSKQTNNEKTNLLIFMTPKIIRQYEKVRAILDQKLKERDEFIEAHTGGSDHLRDKRDDIIRSLPDLSKVTNEKVKPRTRLNDDELDEIVQSTESNAAYHRRSSQNNSPNGTPPPAVIVQPGQPNPANPVMPAPGSNFQPQAQAPLQDSSGNQFIPPTYDPSQIPQPPPTQPQMMDQFQPPPQDFSAPYQPPPFEGQ